jgi:hypothetical protein
MTAVCHVRGCYGIHHSVPFGQDSTYSWATASCCTICERKGYLCIAGCRLKKALDNRVKLKHHNYRMHGITPGLDLDHSFMFDGSGSDTDDVIGRRLVVPPIILQSKALQSFVEQAATVGMLASIRRFVATACFGSFTLPLDIINGVPLPETFIVILTARLVFRIGTVNQALLSSLLSMFVLARPQTGPSSLPITRSQMIRVITNASNRTSIVSTIPTPRPVELGSRHAYLALEEVIGHALGLQPADGVTLEKYQRLMNSPRGQRCLDDAKMRLDVPETNHLRKLVCCLTFWFDGWDPNSSMSKANKTPIWSGTATLIFGSLDGRVDFVTTRLVTSGPGKADHMEVIDCILQNMVSLQKICLDRTFWVRRVMDYALVYPSVMLVTCDQPERRSISGLLAGNSKLHACYGVSCDTSLLSRKLEACAGCIAQIDAYVLEAQFELPWSLLCESCLQWTLPFVPGRFSRYEYKRDISPLFPADAVVGSHVNTHASMITTELLRHAWDEAYDKWVVRNEWTAKQVEAYFKVLTINDATTAQFVNQGRRCQLAKAYRKDPNSITSLELRTELETMMKNHPYKYAKPTPPPMWSIVELDQLPEAVMHLAMGVVKAVAKFIHGWATSLNKSPYLTERLNFCINMHRKHCRIGRCPMATYSQLGKFPGWVADTFRSWWIWMPWFYSTLGNTALQYTSYVLPTHHPSQWNGVVCNQFLKSRGYPGYSKLKAKEKQQVVLDMSQKEEWPFDEIIPSACAVTGADLQKMLWHCHSLFKFMFAEPYCKNHQHAADGHSKLLLSTITKLDQLMTVKDNQPNLFEAKYNFISIPRAVRLMTTYGSARNIQEGGIDGEGVVKVLRPLTPRGLKQHFARNLINAYHRDQQLSNFCDEMSAQFPSESEDVTHPATIMEALVDYAETEMTNTDDAMFDDEESKDDAYSEQLAQSEQSNMEDNDLAQNLNEEDSPVFAMDSQQYKRYKSWSVVQELHDLGLPLSFVVADVNNKSSIGLVVGNGRRGTLLPVRIGRVRTNSTIGFTYFETFLNSDVGSWVLLYSHTQEGRRVEHHSVLNYGHLLPHLASLESRNRTSPLPYAVVTTDAYHMNAAYRFV